jgi:hypothetical protein
MKLTLNKVLTFAIAAKMVIGNALANEDVIARGRPPSQPLSRASGSTMKR